MYELIPAFETSLFCDSFEDIGKDLAEIGIDSILQDGLLKDIPIVNTITSICKFACNVHDRNLLKQTIAFLIEFNKHSVSADKIKKYRMKLSNPKYLESELGRVLILLNRNIDQYKSVLDAKFYVGYINENITWDKFCELCDIVENLFLSDIDILKKIYYSDGVFSGMPILHNHNRLKAVGVLQDSNYYSGNTVLVPEGESLPLKLMLLTDIGDEFCRIAFN